MIYCRSGRPQLCFLTIGSSLTLNYMVVIEVRKPLVSKFHQISLVLESWITCEKVEPNKKAQILLVPASDPRILPNMSSQRIKVSITAIFEELPPILNRLLIDVID